MSNEDEKVKNSIELEKLVVLAQEGDQNAFAKVYDLLIDQVYRYVFYRIKGEDVEDMVENVFLKVWENIRKYRSEPKKSFTAWVFRITHNMIVDHYRITKDRDHEELSLDLADESRDNNPVRKAEDGLDNESLKTALSKLKKPYRDVIIYKFLNEFSNKEIAEILDKNEGSLRVLQFRALAALKKELQEMGIHHEF